MRPTDVALAIRDAVANSGLGLNAFDRRQWAFGLPEPAARRVGHRCRGAS